MLLSCCFREEKKKSQKKRKSYEKKENGNQVSFILEQTYLILVSYLHSSVAENVAILYRYLTQMIVQEKYTTLVFIMWTTKAADNAD